MAPPVVVANTTPLIALAWLARLDLLPTLFGRVHIPQAVHDEIHHNPAAIGVAELSEAPWLVVVPVSNALAVALLSDQLDAGESEAIVLAHEMEAGLLLMDERRGRRRAVQSGLTVSGTLGILITAHQRGLIGPLRPLLDRLRELPFHMSETLYADVLHRVGE
jgi:predicted nucleic acid-binding protein